MNGPANIRGCSVNLVPVAQCADRDRNYRRTAWIIICAVAGVLLGTGWGIQHLTTGALEQVANAVDELDVQRTEIQRRMMMANARRAELLNELRTIAATRKPQPWARRLTDLMREAPAGIYLTALDIGPAGGGPRGSKANRPGRQQAGDSGAAPSELSVRLSGYAPGHDALLQLVNTLQDQPDWQRVELVRAIQESRSDGPAIAFDLDCTAPEGRP